jgi:tRNA (cytosine38-C5)-methyltransferase
MGYVPFSSFFSGMEAALSAQEEKDEEGPLKESATKRMKTFQEIENHNENQLHTDNPNGLYMYLEDEAKGEEYFRQFLVPESLVKKKGLLFDIVKKEDNRSCCFTKAYGRFVEGTGSVLQTASPDQVTKPITDNESVLQLKLRFFTPREVASLHGFPPEFSFPSDLTTRQMYQLLGNSLNVLVVAELIKYLLRN